MIKNISGKLFLTLCLLIFISSAIYSMEYEKEIEENFLISDKLGSLTEKINEKEKIYLNTIKNLKIRHYLLSKKYKEILNAEEIRSNLIEEKIYEWKKTAEKIEKIKNKLPLFLREEFRAEKKKLMNLFDTNEDFEVRADAFKNFLEAEMEKSLNCFFREGLFYVNGEPKKGRALISGNNTVILKTEGGYYLWDKGDMMYKKVEHPELKNIFSEDDPAGMFFKPVFLETENEKN